MKCTSHRPGYAGHIVGSILLLLLWVLLAADATAQPGCPTGARLTTDGHCTCPIGTRLQQNACVRDTCPTGQIRTPDGLRCIPVFCPPGLVKNTAGRCVAPPCPPGWSRNASGQCASNIVPICPQFSQWNGSQCVCAPGFRPLSNGTCVRAGPF